MAGPLGAADASPRVTDAGAAGRASAFPQIRQAAGIQMAAQNAGQPPVVSATSSLKELAHADTAFVKETIGRITQDLARYVTRDSDANIGSSSAIAQHLVNEGVELQRSADFADQGKAKIWTLRVLSWIGSVITLGALPGLTKLLAPESDFADSLSRYLLGNGPEVDKDKLKNFSMLFEKFQNLNTLLASENLTDGDKVRISSGLYSNGSTKDTMTPEAQTVFEQAFPVYQEINRLIFDLGTPKEISGQEIAHAIAENFKNNYGEGRKAAPGSTDPHFNINWETAITSDIFDQAEPKFPAACKVEVDMMLRSDFKLSIGNKSITRGELWEGTSTADEKATNTRRWILGAIQELTNNKGQQVAILRNFLSTCIGQATNADTRIAFMAHARDEHGSLDVTQPNSIFYGVTIDMHGSCHIENTASYSQCAFSPPDDPASVIYVPSNIRMTVAYESSLEDFINDRPPHAIEDQCTVSGRCLDVSAMM